MSNDIEEDQKPHIADTLKKARSVKVNLLIYAAITVSILWMYPSDWLGFVLVFGFGFLAFGRLNKIFSGSDWNMYKQGNEERDSSDDRR